MAPAAFLVKVRPSILSGGMPWLTRLPIRAAMVRVLPDPGMAITDAVPNMKAAAAFCWSFSWCMVSGLLSWFGSGNRKGDLHGGQIACLVIVGFYGGGETGNIGSWAGDGVRAKMDY